jgi:cytochrome P450
MFAYMNRLIDLRQSDPKDDLIAALALAEVSGLQFSRDESLATRNTLLTAGHETTTNLISDLVHLLLANPGHWEQLQSEPASIDAAIEEALRFDAPKQRNFRRVKKSHTFAETALAENEMIFQPIGSANRDERSFQQPEIFDIRRRQNDHLSFGFAIHFCLGPPGAHRSPDCLGDAPRIYAEMPPRRGLGGVAGTPAIPRSKPALD